MKYIASILLFSQFISFTDANAMNPGNPALHNEFPPLFDCALPLFSLGVAFFGTQLGDEWFDTELEDFSLFSHDARDSESAPQERLFSVLPEEKKCDELEDGDDSADQDFCDDVHSVKSKNRPAKKKPFVCDQCGKSYIQKSSLTRHKKHIHSKRRAPSSSSEDTFQNATTLEWSSVDSDEEVQAEKTESKKRKRPCKGDTDKSEDSDYCENLENPPKRSKSKVSDTTTSTIGFPCSVCKKTFRDRHRLSVHMTAHSNKRPFECNLCNSTFKTKDGLTRHIREIHNRKGREALTCEQCGNQFSSRDNLRQHLKIIHVDGGEIFDCDLCGREFKQKTKLRRHLSTVHSSKEPFECGVCGKSFNLNDNRLRHERDIHDFHGTIMYP